MESTALANISFIDELCKKRKELIETQSQSLILLKKSHELCTNIDSLIPCAPGAFIDSMTSIFYTLKRQMGEFIKISPKEVDIITYSDEAITGMIEKIVDNNLWQMLFNRLNINGLLSASARKQMSEELKVDCLPFTPENVQSTLLELSDNREHMLLNALYETVCNADTSYANNSNKQFNKKTVFTDAIKLVSYSYFKPQTHGAFQDALKFLSYFVFADRVSTDKLIVNRNYLSNLVEQAFDGYEIKSAKGMSIEFEGGEIRFFQNGNAHLTLEPAMVSFLNNALAKGGALFEDKERNHKRKA